MKDTFARPLTREEFADSDITRLWSKIRTGAPHECWEWCAAPNHNGYGFLNIKNRSPILAHRIAYVMAHGSIAGDRNVLHNCDNPLCCNPSHLRAGTQMENMRDKMNRGRYRHGEARAGEKHHNAKLTEQQVIAILADKRLPREICLDYGVSVSTIQYIRQGKLWSHLRRSA